MRIITSTIFLVFFIHLSSGQIFERIETSTQLDFLSHTTGVAIADYDNDNDLDIFVVAKFDLSPIAPTTWSRLFSNNNDGTFEDVTQEAGFANLHNYDIPDPGWKNGVKIGASWGDYDNDGYPDLFLTNYHSFQLFHNEGNGRFEEVTAAAGFPTTDTCYNYTALWWDWDRDGYLDIFVPNWLGCTRNKFYHNNGDGTFTEKAEALNLTGTKEGSLMSVPIDANNDGLWDIYIANDFGKNELFIQNTDHTFTDMAPEYQADYLGNDMGIAIGDYDNDGAFDIYVSNISKNRLLTPSGNDTYLNLAEEKNVLNTYWGWDTRFADFDLDGDEDLFVLNGYENDVALYTVLKENFYFKNMYREGQETFLDHSEASQVHEFSNSLSMGVFDYDHDGDLDILVSNTNDSPFFYENKTTQDGAPNEPHWANINLEGTVSNRDGLGSQLKLWSGGHLQHRLYYGAGFLSQSLQAVHFGLGEATMIDSLEILWNSGINEKFYNLPADQHFHFVEGQGYTILNIGHEKIYGCTDPNACSYDVNATFDDGSCTYLPAPQITGNVESGYLSTEIYSCANNAGSSFHWSVEHGVILSGQGTATITVKWELEKKGKVSVKETGTCESDISSLEVDLSYAKMDDQYSVARLWNEALLLAIRNDFARPTVHARNLFHTSVAMYDAWAVFDEAARTFLLGKNVHGFQSEFLGFTTDVAIEEAKKMSISYAAYRLLHSRFSNSPGYAESRAIFNELFAELGYDKNNTSTDYTSGDPATLGNYIAQVMISFGRQDGANELSEYANTHYETLNAPLITNNAGNPNLQYPNNWQPLALETFIDQAGNLITGSTPDFLSPEWGNVVPFSLKENTQTTYARMGNTYQVFHDPGTPPLLDTLVVNESSEQYQWGFALVSVWGAHLSPQDNVMWDISPKSIGNVAFSDLPRDFGDYPNFYKKIEGGDIGQGRSINPITNEPYPTQLVPRGDYARVLAEFWADGPDSETPPGHWFVLLNKVSDHPLTVKKLGGKGRTLPSLEWDVKSYFILGGTMHDAAIAAWSVKGCYDYIRPISAIRYMADRGQSSDPSLPNFAAGGIPLLDGYIEVVAAGDELAGINNEHVGKIKLYTWRGPTLIFDPATDEAGVGWILAENWMPYQRPSFVTPPFAGYVSGHSTYSRAAAEVMTMLTGDEYFPGGVGEFIAYKNEFLVFEEGPSQDVILQWATYRDASDQCSLSRIWGGIHPPADDIPGRLIGEKVGKDAFAFAIPYFSSEVPVEDLPMLVYPNPVLPNDVLTLENTTSEMELRIVDIQGKTVPFTVIEQDDIFRRTTLQLGNVTSGVYVVSADDRSWKVVVTR
ncbi:MAG: FG-GAP-like repeat-containing protein [Bacteroidota bacterium]